MVRDVPCASTSVPMRPLIRQGGINRKRGRSGEGGAVVIAFGVGSILFLSCTYLMIWVVLLSRSKIATFDHNRDNEDGAGHDGRSSGQGGAEEGSSVSYTKELLRLLDRLKDESTYRRTLKSCITTGRGKNNDIVHGTEHKCLEHVPPGSRPRVGILSPPGRISEAMADWIIRGLDRYDPVANDSNLGHGDGGGGGGDVVAVAVAASDIDVIPTSHVPPYGYGKSHGWTKIVRLDVAPLALGVLDLAAAAAASAAGAGVNGDVDADAAHRHSESNVHLELGRANVGKRRRFGEEAPPPSSSLRHLVGGGGGGGGNRKAWLTEEDLIRTLSQTVRWHCRLSHVSAHTAMMTVSLDDVLEHPDRTMEELLLFIFSRDGDEVGDDSGGGGGGGGGGGVSDLHSKSRAGVDGVPSAPDAAAAESTEDIRREMYAVCDDVAWALSSSYPSSSRMTEPLSKQRWESLMRKMDASLSSELSRTNGLSDWPCLSFWDFGYVRRGVGLGGGGGGIDDGLSDVGRWVARSLAPNCTAEYTKCGVKRDRCEEVGDAKCSR